MSAALGLKEHVPLSPGQRALYRHAKFYPEDTAYNLTFLTRIDGALDPDRLARAHEAVINAADAFKSEFIELGANVYQHVDRDRAYRVAVVRRPSDVSETAFVSEVRSLAQRLQHTPMQRQWPFHHASIHVVSETTSYLVVSVPHLIADGYSYSLCLEAISARYNDERVPIRFEPRLDRSTDTRDPRARDYFESELSGLDTLEVSALSQARDVSGGISGRIVAFDLSRERIDQALALAKRSASQFFLAAYVSLLRRVVPAGQLVVGYAVPNRSAEAKDAIGCFVTTAPVVFDVSAEATFADVADIVRRKLFRLYRYQAYDPEDFTNLSPRLSCLFTLYPQEFTLNLERCACVAEPVIRKHFPAEIRLTVETRRESYRLVFDLGTYFDQIDVEAAMRTIVERVSADGSARLAHVALDESVLDEQPVHAGFDESGVSREFEAIAREHASRIALVCGDHTVTYGDLNALANRMARSLSPRVGERRNVVLLAEKSNATIAAILAVMKLGKCYVPLDPRMPSERLAAILSELDDPFVIAYDDSRSERAGITLDRLLEDSRSNDDRNLATEYSPRQPAYMIYTSGSTGEPKGVTISHANLLSLIRSCDLEFEFDEEDVWTLFHSFSFDYSIWEMFGALLHGARLVLVDFLTTQDPQRLHALLRREGVTILNHTPSVFRNLMREDCAAGGTLAPRYVFLGGEALHFPSLREWVKLHPLSDCPIINLYGPTEATVLVTFFRVRERDLSEERSLIGRPIPGTCIAIRSAEGDIVPAGVPGEIVVCGAGVAREYHKRPDATRERFVTHSNQTEFRTGDLGKVRLDGNIEYLGRIDRQVKVRGFRVELAEIESALRKTRLVTDCAVDLVEFSEPNDSRLVAYVVCNETPFHEASLRVALKTLLPAYMLPSLVVQVESIPTTMSGKTDFAELARRAQAPVSTSVGETPTERMLHDAIAAIVKHDGFDRGDNLFDIGLVSLDIVELVGVIRKQPGFEELNVLTVFEHPTITTLAAYLDSSRTVPANEHANGNARAEQRRRMLSARKTVASSNA